MHFQKSLDLSSFLSGGLCYTKERSGYKHFPSFPRDILSVSTVSECSNQCRRSAYCYSFSYRYFSLGSSAESSRQNCLLSHLGNPASVSSADNLIVDSNWDVFRQRCKTTINDQDIESKAYYYKRKNMYSETYDR